MSISVISNGIDSRLFHPRAAKKGIYEKYDIPINKPLIFFVGRIEKEKQLDILLKAFQYTYRKTKAHLVIAGNGNQLNELKQLSKDLQIGNAVHFLGKVSYKEDLPELYTIMTVFVMPSIYESQCIAGLEAAASGLPIVAANAGALPELVISNKNGYLFKPGNFKDLNNKLVRIINNEKLQRSMARESLIVAKKHMSNNVYQEIVNLYEDTLKQKKKRRFFLFK